MVAYHTKGRQDLIKGAGREKQKGRPERDLRPSALCQLSQRLWDSGVHVRDLRGPAVAQTESEGDIPESPDPLRFPRPPSSPLCARHPAGGGCCPTQTPPVVAGMSCRPTPDPPATNAASGFESQKHDIKHVTLHWGDPL